MGNPLFEHLPKEYLEPNEVSACSEAIDKLFNSLKHNVSLSSDTRKPGPKRLTERSSEKTHGELGEICSQARICGKVLCSLKTAQALPVAPSLQAEAVALAVELDHLLSIYSNLSTEHDSLLRHWRTILNSSSSATGDSGSRSTNGNNGTERPFALMDLTEMVTVAVNHMAFVQLLRNTKRTRVNSDAGKLEFVGVATADAKGMCQLYRSLKDKDKEKTAT
ncbi:unnamed protein product [Echinostoma caproni]|uniref:Uncharacterized protein n=1 Tax=Echinostoma caproni TaxID=27848 RepID=A0A3P8KX70_9TREM|nr:unnamed protein product [Echinostoma caproni]